MLRPTLHWFNQKSSPREVGFLDRNMMLTPMEYMALMRLIESERESEGARVAQSTTSAAPKRRRRRDRKLSEAFKEANARLRTKSGKLRKGKTQADVARLAQRLRKKM